MKPWWLGIMSGGLGRRAPRYYAEDETDRYLRDTFFPDRAFRGVMIEVGGATPEFLSMSRHFKESGWRAVIIEPNPAFVRLHQEAGNEVYAYACSFENRSRAPFQVVNWTGQRRHSKHQISEHSFSSLQVKDAYLQKHNYRGVDDLDWHEILVEVRRLSTVCEEIGLQEVNLLSVDTEGWELEVMQGFDLDRYRPKVVVLENYLDLPEYGEYMAARGYGLETKRGHNQVFLRQPPGPA